NIIERLDPSLHAGVKKVLRQAWDSPTAEQARRRRATARCREGGQPDLGALSVEKHPHKTFIGMIERGLRLPWLSFQSNRADRSQANDHQLYRESISAL